MSESAASGAGQDAEQNLAPPAPPPDLRLRAERPRVMRLSRKVVWTLGAAGSLALALALGYALRSGQPGGGGQQAQDTDTRPSAEGLAGLPKDYTAPPKLGPLLPGDLGKPILNARQQGRGGPVPGMGNQKADQEVEAARTSKLFAQVETHETHDGQATPVVAPASGGQAASPPTDPQAGNRAFLTGEVDRRTESPDRLQKPVSPYVLQAGTIIPGALNTEVNSGLPGDLIGHVTQNVYDSPTGRYLLIPQGSTIFGHYDSSIAFGQDRVLVIWTRLILPGGESIVLEKLPGADGAGNAGIHDKVDNHWGQLFKAALVTTLLSVGSEAGTSWNENNLMQAIRSGASNGFSMVGNRLIDRSLDVQPTLSVRQGFPFNVVVNRDLSLKPYKG